MTSDANDDDRTVIRPPGSSAPTGFQKTEWSAANAIPADVLPADAIEKTQIASAPIRWSG